MSYEIHMNKQTKTRNKWNKRTATTVPKESLEHEVLSFGVGLLKRIHLQHISFFAHFLQSKNINWKALSQNLGFALF